MRMGIHHQLDTHLINVEEDQVHVEDKGEAFDR